MIRVASFAELDPIELYRILALRASVFAVEQQAIYNDLDGRDLEAVFVWFEEGDGDDEHRVVSALRLLVEPDGSRVLGRVATSPAARGRGIAGSLIDRALALVPPGASVSINAQARLEPWYARWGFRRSGPDNYEDGIRHVPMTRPGP